MSRGRSTAHRSRAYGQRVRNGHPVGLSAGLGTSPVSTMRSRGGPSSADVPSSMSGTADSRACVYGWAGSEYNSSVPASSTISPRYMTAIRSDT